jgi:hypothetical protein
LLITGWKGVGNHRLHGINFPEFPVFFPVKGNLKVQTGSMTTVSSANYFQNGLAAMPAASPFIGFTRPLKI